MKQRNLQKRYFEQHILDFMEKARLFPPSKRAYVALSGGVDSMVLLHVFANVLRNKRKMDVRAIHINHGIRVESDKEEKFVLEVCRNLGIEVEVKCLNLGKSCKGSLEKLARNKRYEFFQKVIQKGDRIYTAHHLDDSFEWFLMQILRSGNLRTSLGIPVKNGNILRPLLCVEKKQIEYYAKCLEIPSVEDSSNSDLSFDRNYIRHKVIPSFAKKYPSYLKNYSHWANELAWILGKSRFEGNFEDFFQVKDGPGNYLVGGWDHLKDRSVICGNIIEVIKNLSSNERGNLKEQVRKFLEVKPGKRGPMIFSGNVLGFPGKTVSSLMSKKSYYEFLSFDEKTCCDFRHRKQWKHEKFSYESFKTELHHRILNKGEKSFSQTFPFWVVASSSGNRKTLEKIVPSLKKMHPLWPQTSKFLIDKGFWIRPAAELLYCWKEHSTLKKEELPLIF